MQGSGHLKDLPGIQVLQIGIVDVVQRLHGLVGPVDEPPYQGFFVVLQITKRWELGRGERRPTPHGRLTDLVADHAFCNTCLVGDPVAKLVARGRVRDARRHREHPAQEQPAVVGLPQVEAGHRLIEQVLQIRL